MPMILLGQKPGTNLPSIGRLYGKIVEASSKQGLAFASVIVMKKLPNGKDSIIGGGLTEDNGDFNITNLPMGPLTVKASYIGNKDVTKQVKISPPNNIEQDLGDILIYADAQMLNEVEVKAQKSTMTMSLEKKVFNVDRNLNSAGGTAEDVLKSVPSVTLDSEGKAKLRDKETLVYVDGKPTFMQLNQIPADQIESVEVMSNASAKYEASATGGILNIVMKKNIKPGYNGNIIAGIGTQKRYNAGLNLNVNADKLSLTGSYMFNTADVQTLGYTYLTNLQNGNPTNYFNQDNLTNFNNQFQNGKVSIGYALNNRNTISLSGDFMKGKFNVPTSQEYDYLTANREVSSSGERTTTANNSFTRRNAELMWKKTYAKKDKSLLAFVNYQKSIGTNLSTWTTKDFDNQSNLINTELVDIVGPSDGQQMVAQLDYVNPVNDSSKIEMGLRTFVANRDQQYIFSVFDNDKNKYLQDNRYSQITAIDENVNAAYFTYSSKWKYAISYQAGLRFESSNLQGKSFLENTSNFGYTYPGGNLKDILRSLYPAIFLTKTINPSTSLGMSFTRKIQRPGFRQLMPGVQSADRQNITLGNPALQPEFINYLEMNFNKIFGQHNLLTSLYYSNETNTLKPLITQSTTDPGVFITTFVNGSNEFLYGIDNTLKMTFGKNFDFMFSVNAFKYVVNVKDFSNDGYAANGKLNINYKLPAGFAIQVNNSYEGNRAIPQGDRKGIAFMDLALKKNLTKGGASLTLALNDVFNTKRDINIYTQPTFIQEGMRRRESRYFRATVTIPFGKADVNLFRKPVRRPSGEGGEEF